MSVKSSIMTTVVIASAMGAAMAVTRADSLGVVAIDFAIGVAVGIAYIVRRNRKDR